MSEERIENEEAINMPKWLVQTLHDNKFDAPLSSRTRFGSQQTSFASDCYALAISSLCDEDKPVTFRI